jgi:hypothetical protein
MTEQDYADLAAFEALKAERDSQRDAVVNPDEDRPWLDVRIPQPLFDQQKTGAITVPMFMTMSWLYRWSNWHTGKVAFASAGGLRKAMGDVFSVRTIQAAMKELEQMGWITRHLVKGSREDFPVTIHNYKWIDEYGEAHILNPQTIGEPARMVTRSAARLAARLVSLKNPGEATVNTATSNTSSVDGFGDGFADGYAVGCDKILHKGTSIKGTSIRNKVSLLSPIGDDRSLYFHLDDVWNYYLEATHRNPRRNKFTAIKRRIGIVRLRECMAKVRGHPESAVKLMKGAIDALSRSSFHMGSDEKSDGKKYNDWKHVFGTYETMEGWWNT